jgi:cation diffusion facilitator family transporter
MSMAVLSDAIDSGIDVVTSFMARYSVKMASEPADEKHAYGHGKYENLSGLIQAIIIVTIALFIIFLSIRRIMAGVNIQVIEYGIIIMIVSVMGKLIISHNLLRVARKHESMAMEANALNLRADVWMSLGVMVSLSVIWLIVDQFPNIVYLDPIMAIIIAFLIIRAGHDIARKSSQDLLDEQIPEDEQVIIREIMERHSDDYINYHRFRARKSGNERHIDMHLVLPREKSLEEAHTLTEIIESEIKDRLKNSTVVIHMEPCQGDCEGCQKEKS